MCELCVILCHETFFGRFAEFMIMAKQTKKKLANIHIYTRRNMRENCIYPMCMCARVRAYMRVTEKGIIFLKLTKIALSHSPTAYSMHGQMANFECTSLKCDMVL